MSLPKTKGELPLPAVFFTGAPGSAEPTKLGRGFVSAPGRIGAAGAMPRSGPWGCYLEYL